MELHNSTTFLYKATWTLVIILLILLIYYLINIGNTFLLDNKKIKINNKKLLPVLAGMVFLFLIYNLFKKYSILSDTFYTIVFAAALAYLFNPIIDYLEKKNIKRFAGVLLLYLGIIGLVFILAFLVIPKSGTEIRRLASDFPIYIEKASSMVDKMYLVGIESMVVNGLKTFIGTIIATFSKVVSLVLTPILTLYFLVDKDYFAEKAMNIIPSKYRNDSRKLLREIDDSLSKFVRGKMIMAAYVGLATSITLLILGVDFAIVIGFITGFADIIPYIGPLLGFIPAVFFAFLSNPIKAIWVSLFFLFIQWAENNILAPKIIGETIGIHPIIVLLSIIVGGGVFGVLGMILSVPVVVVFMIVFEFVKERLKISKTEDH